MDQLPDMVVVIELGMLDSMVRRPTTTERWQPSQQTYDHATHSWVEPVNSANEHEQARQLLAEEVVAVVSSPERAVRIGDHGDMISFRHDTRQEHETRTHRAQNRR